MTLRSLSRVMSARDTWPESSLWLLMCVWSDAAPTRHAVHAMTRDPGLDPVTRIWSGARLLLHQSAAVLFVSAFFLCHIIYSWRSGTLYDGTMGPGMHRYHLKLWNSSYDSRTSLWIIKHLPSILRSQPEGIVGRVCNPASDGRWPSDQGGGGGGGRGDSPGSAPHSCHRHRRRHQLFVSLLASSWGR